MEIKIKIVSVRSKMTSMVIDDDSLGILARCYVQQYLKAKRELHKPGYRN